MESWSHVSGGKGYASNETISDSDSFARSKYNFLSWNSKSSCDFSNNTTMASGTQVFNNNSFADFGVQDFVEEESVNHLFRDISGEGESCSKLSSSVVETKNHSMDSSALIDLKLGGVRVLSSSDSCRPPKRTRISGLNSSQIAYCLVYGCNKDLSSSKEYHKRHKVCEVHSKAAKVIVNGIEQRFRQQCSRFHVLAEFDDGKRGCRERLQAITSAEGNLK